MKFNTPIMSVDDSFTYRQFWEPVSMVWNLKFGVRPVLIYFGECDDLSEQYGDVVKVSPVEGIPQYIQSVWARFWYTTLDLDKTYIISDIDMFPVSKKFFVYDIVEYPDDVYLHLRGEHRPLPCCYHVAKGSVFKRVLGLHNSFEESCKDVLNFKGEYSQHMGYEKWGIEESYITHILESYTGDDLVLMPRGVHGSSGREIPKSLEIVHDYHSDRSYQQHKLKIDSFIVNNLLLGDRI